MNKLISKLTHVLLTVGVLLFIIFEEFVWDLLARPIVRYIQSLQILQKLSLRLQDVRSGVILSVFIILFVITELQGIYAGILLMKGNLFSGALVYAGKIPIAAFTFWLFRITKDKLMVFAWFKKSYLFVMDMIDQMKTSDTYIGIKMQAAEIKHYLKQNYKGEDDDIKIRLKRIYTKLRTYVEYIKEMLIKR